MIQSDRSTIFRPIGALRASERVARAIRESIVDGSFGVDELLPPERTLAERFEVTRNTVREALRRLEQLRLVVIRQGSGVRVQDYLATAGVEFLVHLLGAERGDSELFRDLLDARVVIGEAICCSAIETFDDAELPALRRAVEAFATAATTAEPDPRELQALEFDLHASLLRGGGNRALVLLHNSVRHVYQGVAHLFEHLMADDPRAQAAAYRELLAALDAGDARRAKLVVKQSFAKGRPPRAHKRKGGEV